MLVFPARTILVCRDAVERSRGLTSPVPFLRYLSCCWQVYLNKCSDLLTPSPAKVFVSSEGEISNLSAMDVHSAAEAMVCACLAFFHSAVLCALVHLKSSVMFFTILNPYPM